MFGRHGIASVESKSWQTLVQRLVNATGKFAPCSCRSRRTRAAPNVHQQMCTTRRPFQRFGGLLSNHPNQNPKDDEFSNEKVRCRKVSATLSRSLKCWEIQEKCKDAIFSRTVFANEKTHLGPTLTTCNVGAAGSTKKPSILAIFCSLACAHLLVHVRCPLKNLNSTDISAPTSPFASLHTHVQTTHLQKTVLVHLCSWLRRR